MDYTNRLQMNPVPKPRNLLMDSSKKPVPLPRKLITQQGVKKQNESKSARSSGALLSSATKSQSSFKSYSEEPNLPEETVQEKVKSFSNRKNTLSKSFFSRPRRTTTYTTHKSNDEHKIERSHSLPADNIFESISFKSPLVADDGEKETLNIDMPEDDQCQTFNAPPPIYPPPPLPDESVYDEVQSVKSQSSVVDEFNYANSDTVSCCDSASIYEDVSTISSRANDETENISLNIENVDGSSFQFDMFRPSDASAGSSSKSQKSLTPCNYDSLSLSSSLRDSYVNERATSRSSISPSVLSELEMSEYNSSPEDAYEEDRFNSPVTSNIYTQNDFYDNWDPKHEYKAPDIPLRQKGEPSKKVNSVIIEFDPLFDKKFLNRESIESNVLVTNDLYDLSVAESPYGKIKRPTNNVGTITEEVCPPIPPRRVDSIVPKLGSDFEPEIPEQVINEDSLEQPQYPRNSDRLSIRNLTKLSSERPTSSQTKDESSKPRKPLSRWPSVKHAIKLVSDSSWSPVMRRNVKQSGKNIKEEEAVFFEDSAIEIEPPYNCRQATKLYSANLFKITGNSRERQKDVVELWCNLSEAKFVIYGDKSMATVKDVVHLSTVTSVHAVMDYKLNIDGDCFEINSEHGIYRFGTSGPTERLVWMQKLLESLTSVFPNRITAEYALGGWCFIKEGINGAWSAAWLIIHERILFYSINGSVQEADLRKARCIVLQDVEKGTEVPKTINCRSVVLVDFHPGQSLYLHMNTNQEAVAWQKAIHDSAVNNGLNLSQQQLTGDDIPVIVDKCINFVYAHGSLSEGIYRRAGTNSSITRLLAHFRQDSWQVQISRDEYSEYEVANVMKRFFRELPECLLTSDLYKLLCDISMGNYGNDKLTYYKTALKKLPRINYLTARKIIGHLYFIHEQHEKNRMPVDNLAAIWGPTLLHVEGGDTLETSIPESAVVSDLIRLYPQLFDVKAQELNREKRMLEVLERYHHNNSTVQHKQTGEFKVWIYLQTRDSGSCVNITVGPQKTAADICSELAGRMQTAAHKLTLEEVVCRGELMRPLHYADKVLDVVLRWSYWDDNDRKDNYLVLCKTTLLEEIVPLAKRPLSMCGELKFADQKSKAFKNFLFEFSQAKLCYYKDKDVFRGVNLNVAKMNDIVTLALKQKEGSIKLQEWQIEDIIWYIGHESKRNPHTRWAITFIDKNNKKNRSKETPFFGYTIAGTSREEQLKWMAAMLIGEHPQGLVQSPELLQ